MGGGTVRGEMPMTMKSATHTSRVLLLKNSRLRGYLGGKSSRLTHGEGSQKKIVRTKSCNCGVSSDLRWRWREEGRRKKEEGARPGGELKYRRQGDQVEGERKKHDNVRP